MTTGKVRCRPGDIAVIISSPRFPDDVGRLVRVVRAATIEDCWEPEDTWVIHSLGAPFIVRYTRRAGGPTTSVEMSIEDTRWDARLRPIRGEPDEIEGARPVHRKRPVKAKATQESEQ